MDVTQIPAILEQSPPASAEAIEAVSQYLPAELPVDYAGFLAQADGAIADTFVLYSCETLPERNVTFEVGEYAPGFVTIGDDNGGRAIMLRGGPGRSPVFLVGHGSMQPDFMVQVAECLSDWLAAGCPLGDDD